MVKLSISPTPIEECDSCLNDVVAPGFNEIMDRLKVIRKQEDTTVRSDYFKSNTSFTKVNELCRKKMAIWCFQVVNSQKINRDAVIIGMSYLDLFLSSGAPQAMNAIKSTRDFQLASMTTLYIAIKLFDPVVLSITALVTLSRNTYTAKDFTQMELDILTALNWRLHQPTVLSFLEHFFPLIVPKSLWVSTGRELLMCVCQRYTDLTMIDYYFATQRPSTVATAIISTSLEHISLDFLSDNDRFLFFKKISNALDIESFSYDILFARRRLEDISNQSSAIKPELMLMTSCKTFTSSTTSSSEALAKSLRTVVSIVEKEK